MEFKKYPNNYNKTYKNITLLCYLWTTNENQTNKKRQRWSDSCKTYVYFICFVRNIGPSGHNCFPRALQRAHPHDQVSVKVTKTKHMYLVPLNTPCNLAYRHLTFRWRIILIFALTIANLYMWYCSLVVAVLAAETASPARAHTLTKLANNIKPWSALRTWHTQSLLCHLNRTLTVIIGNWSVYSQMHLAVFRLLPLSKAAQSQHPV